MIAFGLYDTCKCIAARKYGTECSAVPWEQIYMCWGTKHAGSALANARSDINLIKAQIEAGKTEQLLIDCFKAAGLGRGDDGHVTHSH